MIELKEVSKIYGKKDNTFVALDNVSLSLEKKKVIAIVGKSGSGKSTLMHIIGGLDTPTRGEVMVEGKSLQLMKQKDLDKFRSETVSFIFQAFFVEANQTVLQNVMLPLEISEVPRSKRRQLALKALKAVDLSDKQNNKAKDLSGGQKQRLAIARSIVHAPKIILADEPTGNLDSVTGEKIIQLLFDLNRSLGCTVLIVTHDKELAARCDEQVQVKDGKVIAHIKDKAVSVVAAKRKVIS